jgi:hypothetical protein
MKWIYEPGYRYFHMPYDTGPDQRLVGLVESGRILPCRAIDLAAEKAEMPSFLPSTASR